ncbi:MAG: nitroreductase family protein [Bacteroidales bacterium]|nr:nitroreductase family protein [Bacteroidales bacterium]
MTLNSLYTHRTIRKYKKEKIGRETLNKILDAGIRASNTGNLQLYSIVVSESEEEKAALSPCHFGQPMVKDAAVVLTICADLNRVTQWCRARKATEAFYNFESFLTSVIDASLAAQSMALAAEEEGLGICYLGTTTYNPEEIGAVLNLPKGVVPVTTLTVGVPAGETELTERLPREAVVHYGKYRDYEAADIDKYYREKESLASNQAFVRENSKETLAQVFSEVRYPKETAEAFSKKVVEMLKKQGLI